jgi:hypothetical protein
MRRQIIVIGVAAACAMVAAHACISLPAVGGEGQPCASENRACESGLMCNDNNICERPGGGDAGDAHSVRVSGRYGTDPDNMLYGIGFRCARD